MVPLAAHKRVWTWCCVYPADEHTSSWKKLVFIIFATAVFVCALSVVPASIAFGIKYASTDPGSSLHALFHIAGHSAMSYAIIIGFVLRHKITDIFEQLDRIYSKCGYSFEFGFVFGSICFECFCDSFDCITDKNEDSFRFLVEANKTSDWLWKIYFRCTFMSLINTYIMTIFAILLCWLEFGRFEAEYLYHPYKVVWVKELFFTKICFKQAASKQMSNWFFSEILDCLGMLKLPSVILVKYISI